MDTKIIGIILLACAAIIFQYSYDDFLSAFFSPSTKLKRAIEEDITNSLTGDTLKNTHDLHHVKIKFRSNNAHEFLKKHPPQFQTKKEGKVWLEIEVLDLDDNENPGFITQISVFDIKSGNKISEFGQTYYLRNYDKDFQIAGPITPREMTKPKSAPLPANSPKPSEKK